MTLKSPLSIHFICTGNIYRSRLAEAYLKSKKLPNLTVTSSGTKASLQHKGPILWYSLRLLYRNNLLHYMSLTWRNTLEQYITEADIVIFIGNNNYEFCKQQFPTAKKFEVWDLPDFDDRNLNGKPLNLEVESQNIKISEEVFDEIKNKVNNLVIEINKL